MNWEQYNALDFEGKLLIDEAISERICGDAKEPFLIEPFCAEVSWMKNLSCPMYPYEFSGEGICDFLHKQGYENYRCPNARLASEIFGPIILKGNEEQKEALRYLAGIWKRYALMEATPFEKSETLVAETIDLLFSLGMVDDGMKVIESFPSFGKIISLEQERERRYLLALDSSRIKSGVPFSRWRRMVLE